MSNRDDRLITNWRVYGTAEEIFSVLADPADLPRWWPSVCLAVAEIEPGRDGDGVGRRVALLTRGWLPYTLGWRLKVVSSRRPHEMAIEADGDLEGRGVWTLTPQGAWVDVRFEWEVEAVKPLLRALSPLFSFVLAANHRWAMARGAESLSLELSRRRAAADFAGGEPKSIAAPPGPATHSGFLLAAAAAGLLGLVVGVAAAARRTRPRRRFSISRRRG